MALMRVPWTLEGLSGAFISHLHIQPRSYRRYLNYSTRTLKLYQDGLNRQHNSGYRYW